MHSRSLFSIPTFLLLVQCMLTIRLVITSSLYPRAFSIYFFSLYSIDKNSLPCICPLPMRTRVYTQKIIGKKKVTTSLCSLYNTSHAIVSVQKRKTHTVTCLYSSASRVFVYARNTNFPLNRKRVVWFLIFFLQNACDMIGFIYRKLEKIPPRNKNSTYMTFLNT